jgi:hypothetical protein
MNISEFGKLMNHVISAGISEGLNKRKMELHEMVGVMEMQKAGLIRLAQDVAAKQAQKNEIVIPLRSNVNDLPG